MVFWAAPGVRGRTSMIAADDKDGNSMSSSESAPVLASADHAVRWAKRPPVQAPPSCSLGKPAYGAAASAAGPPQSQGKAAEAR